MCVLIALINNSVSVSPIEPPNPYTLQSASPELDRLYLLSPETDREDDDANHNDTPRGGGGGEGRYRDAQDRNEDANEDKEYKEEDIDHATAWELLVGTECISTNKNAQGKNHRVSVPYMDIFLMPHVAKFVHKKTGKPGRKVFWLVIIRPRSAYDFVGHLKDTMDSLKANQQSSSPHSSSNLLFLWRKALSYQHHMSPSITTSRASTSCGTSTMDDPLDYIDQMGNERSLINCCSIYECFRAMVRKLAEVSRVEDIVIEGFTDVKHAIRTTEFDVVKDIRARVEWRKVWQEGKTIGTQWELPEVSGWPVMVDNGDDTSEFVHGIPPCECAMLVSPPDNLGKSYMETTVDGYIRGFGDIPAYCSVYLTLLCYPDNEGMDRSQICRYIPKASKVDHFIRSETAASAKNMIKTIVMGGYNLAIYKSNLRMITSSCETEWENKGDMYAERVRKLLLYLANSMRTNKDTLSSKRGRNKNAEGHIKFLDEGGEAINRGLRNLYRNTYNASFSAYLPETNSLLREAEDTREHLYWRLHCTDPFMLAMWEFQDMWKTLSDQWFELEPCNFKLFMEMMIGSIAMRFGQSNPNSNRMGMTVAVMDSWGKIPTMNAKKWTKDTRKVCPLPCQNLYQ